MKKLTIIYCEANGECLVMNEFKDTIPVLPNVGDRVGLGSAFYKVENRDFVYVEETNTVVGSAFYKVENRDFVYVEETNTVEVYIYLDN